MQGNQKLQKYVCKKKKFSNRMRPQNSIVVFGLEEFREIYNVLQTLPMCIIETFLFIFAKKLMYIVLYIIVKG